MEPLITGVIGEGRTNYHTETRCDERCGCEAIVKWSYFNENIQFDAKIINFSRSGLYMESDQAIKPGATIVVRLEILLSRTWGSSDFGWLRSISLGEVKWCSELNITGGVFYGIGVQYYHAD